MIDLKFGDSLEVLRELKENSVDSVVTDPPYHLVSINKRFSSPNARNTPAMETKEGSVWSRKAKGFMGKDWDGVDENGIGIACNVELWRQVFRVMKPGAHLLSFGGTRTYHRMACAIEDAGFEIRDQLQWLYGSGFPKSHNIGKAVDKKLGNEREKVADGKSGKPESHNIMNMAFEEGSKSIMGGDYDITKGSSKFEGWGSALKPANEPICLARKPLSEKTIVENVLKWGTGGLNIDASRIGTDKMGGGTMPDLRDVGKMSKENCGIDKLSFGQNIRPALRKDYQTTIGRFPANVLLDEEAGRLLDNQSGISKSNKRINGQDYSKVSSNINIGGGNKNNEYSDKGGASRFFYCAKSGKKERNLGCEHLEEKKGGCMEANVSDKMQLSGASLKGEHKSIQSTNNNHPTVKPVKLMSYLIKLVTPVNGIVLDPFMGSGTTGIACKQNGFGFVGIEKEKEYLEIAKARIFYEERDE